MSRHAGYGVVKNDNGRIGCIVSDVHKSRHTGMHKRGVSDNGNGFLLSFRSARFVKAVNARNGRAHAKGRVKRVERRLSAERITADVAENRNLVFCKDVIHSSVRAARAHHRRTNGNGVFKRGERFVFNAERFRDFSLRKFAEITEKRFALNFKSERKTMVFYNGVKFLDNDKALDF